MVIYRTPVKPSAKFLKVKRWDPLLFLLYVNDLYKSSNKIHFCWFADGTSVTYANRDLKTLVFNEELSMQSVYVVNCQ